MDEIELPRGGGGGGGGNEHKTSINTVANNQGATSGTVSTNQDDSSTASSKPARRRRLAHRRQYAKSRQLASSALRSQFVRYDFLENSGPDAKGADSEDDWCRVQTFDTDITANITEPTSLPASARHCEAELQADGQQQHQFVLSPAHWTKFDDCLNERQRQQQQQQQQHPHQANQEDLYFANYSSSSLDSYCLIADNSTNVSATNHHIAGANLANARQHSPCPNQTIESLNHPPGTNTKDLYSHTNTNFTNKRGENVDNMKSSNIKSEFPIGSKQQAKIVVRSETVDLTRVSFRQSNVDHSVSSPMRPKFFPLPQQTEEQTVIGNSSRLAASSGQSTQIEEISRLSASKVASADNLVPSYCQSYVGQQNHHHQQQQQKSAISRHREGSNNHNFDDVHYTNEQLLFLETFSAPHDPISSLAISQSVKSDPRLYSDDVDIKFSRALNSCKLPQIRFASKERLFERLTDLRFLSIDFLNTFLITYRVFTTGEDVLEALKSVHYNFGRYYKQNHQFNAHEGNNKRSARNSICSFANSSMGSSQGIDSSSTALDCIGFGFGRASGQRSPPVNCTSTSSSNQAPPTELRLDSTKISSSSPSIATASNKQGRLASAQKQTKAAAVAPVTSKLIQPNVHRDKKTPGQAIQNRPTQKPSVPPRSPGVGDLFYHNVSGNNMSSRVIETNKYLLAPNPLANQKRRSTISELTTTLDPTSSSSVNLNSGFVSNSVANYNRLQVQSPRSSENLETRTLQTQPNSPFADSSFPSPMSALSMEDDESSKIESQRDCCSLSGDRTRSASMTHTRQLLPVSPLSDSRVNLNVPAVRQIRASSLSHMTDATRKLILDPVVKRSATAASSTSDENWMRLNFNQFSSQKQQQQTAAEAVVKIDPKLAKGKGVGQLLLAGGNFNLVSDTDFMSAPTRRASSSDANVDANDTSCAQRQWPVASESSRQTLVAHKESQFQASVPPSSPTRIVEAKNAPVDCQLPVELSREQSAMKDSVYKTTSRQNLKAKHRTKRISRRPLNSASSSSIQKSASSSSLSSRSSPTTTRSVLTSQSESELIQSTSSNSEVLTSHGQSVSPSNSSKTKRGQSSRRCRTATFGAGSRRRAHRPGSNPLATGSGSGGNLVQNLFGIKEIELAEAKILDCDTSADEDRISTSSADIGNDIEESDSDSDIDARNKMRTATEKQHDDGEGSLVEGRNFQIVLTKLSRVNMSAKDDSLDALDVSLQLDDQFDSLSCPFKSKSTTVGDNILCEQSKSRTNRESVPAPPLPVPRSRIAGRAGSGSGSGLAHGNSNASQKTKIKAVDTLDRGQGIAVACDSNQTSFAEGEAKGDTTQEQRIALFDLAANVVHQTATCDTTSKSVAQTMKTSDRMYAGRDNSIQRLNKLTSDKGDKLLALVDNFPPRRCSAASIATAFVGPPPNIASSQPVLNQPDSKETLMRDCGRSIVAQYRTNRIGDSHCSASSQLLASPANSPPNNQYALPAANRAHHRSATSVRHVVAASTIPTSATTTVASPPSSGTPPNCSRSSSINPLPTHVASVCDPRACGRLSSCAGLELGASDRLLLANMSQTMASANSPSTLKSLFNQQQQQRSVSLIKSNNSSITTTTTTTCQATNNYTFGNTKRSDHQAQSNAPNSFKSVATIRILSIMKHWISRHSQDFANNPRLAFLAQEFVSDLIKDTSLLPAEHKAAQQLQQLLFKASRAPRPAQIDLDSLLAPPSKPSNDSIETLSALEIAEGMTFLDHKIFLAIQSEEFLGQAWMKVDKAIRAPHILLITKRFNDVSRLVSSEIIRVAELNRRVAIIEKWTNVAHICRVVHNFNGVLQICAAFTNSAVFRLKKTWDKIPKTTKTTIDQLQNLVSTDSRFRNMREAISRCDPPSIPYVGMYLTDLSFIEEGSPNYSPDGLLNFSKMRMIAHVIREIQHLQTGSYKIEMNRRVANYLLDASRHLQDEEMYRCSLAIEPKSSGSKNGVHPTLNNSLNNHQTHSGGANTPGQQS